MSRPTRGLPPVCIDCGRRGYRTIDGEVASVHLDQRIRHPFIVARVDTRGTIRGRLPDGGIVRLEPV